MTTKEADALMQKIAHGDNDAFCEFYNLTVKGVFSFAYSYLGNREDAEDVTQSAYLAVKRKAYTYQSGTNARAWLLQIVKNLALDELRKRRRTGELTEERAGEFTDNTALSYMLAELSDEEREIVVLHVFWGYRHREIAKLLNKPLGTITWKYNAEVKKLEKYGKEA
ncbi:MAG: RNA polymerase sigma factor [Clostridia bacterium]|nr:RNA polymerase sigma factor [Clostridia bacterium]